LEMQITKQLELSRGREKWDQGDKKRATHALQERGEAGKVSTQIKRNAHNCPWGKLISQPQGNLLGKRKEKGKRGGGRPSKLQQRTVLGEAFGKKKASPEDLSQLQSEGELRRRRSPKNAPTG